MKRKVIIVGSLFGINTLLQILIRFSSEFSNGYHNDIYPIWVTTLGRLTSVIGISVAEIILYVFVLGSIFHIIYGFVKGNKREHALSILYKFTVIANTLFLIYTLTCGINYQAQSFAEKNHIVLEDYTLEELERTARILTQEVNLSAKRVSRDGNGIMQLSEGVHNRIKQEMVDFGNRYEGFTSYITVPKPLLNSELLSYMQVAGIYSPFTIEANYNADLVPYNIPFTIFHELAHTQGYMREEEANFIAFLICEQAKDEEFRYSGMLLGWVYVTNAIAQKDKILYGEMQSLLDSDVRADLQANREFWKQYDGVIGDISQNINDEYLKVNSQEEGIKSYGRVADYIVNYLR